MMVEYIQADGRRVFVNRNAIATVTELFREPYDKEDQCQIKLVSGDVIYVKGNYEDVVEPLEVTP